MKYRAAVAVLLLALLAVEILPCSFQELPSVASGVSGDFTCRFEPLQVCDNGDLFLGGLTDFPILLPAAPVLLPSETVLCLVSEGPSFQSDGFHPTIDRPPRLSS